MHCFNHPERTALGSCKGCYKGLCMECAADLGHGLACKGKHESMVETYNDIVSRNANVQAARKGSELLMSTLLVIIGIMLVGMAWHAGEVDSISMFMGASFITFGVLVYIYQRKASGTLPKN